MRDSITCCSTSTRFLPSNTSTSKTAASPKPPSPPSPPISVDLLHCKRHSLESHPSLKEVNIEGEVLSEETRAELLLITGYSHCSVLCTSPSSPSNSIEWIQNQVGNGHRIAVGRFSDSTFSRTKQTFGLLENPPSSLLDHRFHLPVSTHSRGYS